MRGRFHLRVTNPIEAPVLGGAAENIGGAHLIESLKSLPVIGSTEVEVLAEMTVEMMRHLSEPEERMCRR